MYGKSLMEPPTQPAVATTLESKYRIYSNKRRIWGQKVVSAVPE